MLQVPQLRLQRRIVVMSKHIFIPAASRGIDTKRGQPQEKNSVSKCPKVFLFKKKSSKRDGSKMIKNDQNLHPISRG